MSVRVRRLLDAVVGSATGDEVRWGDEPAVNATGSILDGALTR